MTEKKKSLDVKIEEKISRISDKTSIPLEELVERYYEIIDELDAPIPNKEQVALIRLSGETTGLRRKPTKFIGFPIGFTGIRDTLEIYRREVRQLIEQEGIEAAKKKGYVQEIDGELCLIDNREYDRFGRPNQNRGEPIPPDKQELSTNIWWILRSSDDPEWKLGRLETTNNKEVRQLTRHLKLFKPYSFYALIRETHPYLVLRCSRARGMNKFKPEKNDLRYDEHLAKVIGITDLTEIPTIHERMKDVWDRYVLVYGALGWMERERISALGIRGLLIDPEKGFESEYQCPVVFPEHIDIDWSEGTVMYVFGKTMPIRTRDRETGKLVQTGVRIYAYGVYPTAIVPAELVQEEPGVEVLE